jgi:hypothetical protein
MTKRTQPKISFGSRDRSATSLLAAELLKDGAIDEIIKRDLEEDYLKLGLLCQQYGIGEGPAKWFQLSLALARELYPEKKKPGRKSKWTLLNKGALVVEIERLTTPDDASHGVAWACKQLALREPWKSFLEIRESDNAVPDPAEALRTVYFKSCSKK